MRVNRFYFKTLSGERKIYLSEGDLFHQIRRVLKLRPGDIISLFREDLEVWYQIESWDKKGLSLKYIKEIDLEKKNLPFITLYQSLIKKDKFEWVVQKAVELGVGRIVPIISARSEKKGLNLDRLNKISLEASEQSGRHDYVEISEIVKFNEALLSLSGQSFLGEFSGDKWTSDIELKESINIFIGPEGGWTPEELSLAKKHQIKFLSLNNYILRSETASIAFLSLLTNSK